MIAAPDAIVTFVLLRKTGILPVYATPGAAGMDLATDIEQPYRLSAGEHMLFKCGFAMVLPPGYEAQVRPRSGLALKHGVTVLNSPGTIDEDYRGEIGVILINHGRRSFMVEPGMRIAQMIIAAAPRLRVHSFDVGNEDKLTPTDRGIGGFGSTGTGS